MKQLTIFTPTYNRKEKLKNVYKSLVEQTNKNFEWIIVDDGSKDNTSDLVEAWMRENIIDIKYFYQENAGKMQAHNKGVLESNCDLFVCLDSDDVFSQDAVEIILDKWNTYDNVVGLINPKYDVTNKKIQDWKNLEGTIASHQEFHEKHGFNGEAMLVYKTKKLEKYLFPQIIGEKFIKEDYIYDQIDQEGNLVFFGDKLYLFEYFDDGYTKNIKKIIYKNPKGYALWANQKMKLGVKLKTRLLAAAKYSVGNMISKEKKYIRKASNKLLTIIMWPVAYLYYLKNYKGLGENND